MKQTLTQLMTSLGCERWPERWEKFYDGVMGDFDKNGCPFADPATLRRELYDYGFLDRSRDGSVYRLAQKQPTPEELGL